MTSKNNPHNLVVGQKLWYVSTRNVSSMPSHELEVMSIGRKWAICGEGWQKKKINIFDLSADGGYFTSPGVCYLSKKHHEKQGSLNRMWDDTRKLFDHRYSRPEHITEQDMIDITAIMERGVKK